MNKLKISNLRKIRLVGDCENEFLKFREMWSGIVENLDFEWQKGKIWTVSAELESRYSSALHVIIKLYKRYKKIDIIDSTGADYNNIYWLRKGLLLHSL